jgi:hypothetical protein
LGPRLHHALPVRRRIDQSTRNVSNRTEPLIPAPGLSQVDIDEVKKFYPPIHKERQPPRLRPFQSQRIEVAPGQQLDFLVELNMNRTYTIQTFGRMDTVMVLFVDVNGEQRYLAGDDDSGTDLNAKIRIRLFKERNYILRVRLYHRDSSGAGAIFMY